MIHADARRCELFGEDLEGLHCAQPLGGNGLPHVALQHAQGFRCIKRWWVETHAIDCIGDDGVSESLAVLVVIVHPIAVGFIRVPRRLLGHRSNTRTPLRQGHASCVTPGLRVIRHARLTMSSHDSL